MNFHSLKINKIVSETVDAKTIYFQIPSDLKETFAHLPGQYLTIKADINGKECRRAYSICTPPNQDSIGVTVKKVVKGVMTSYIHSSVKEGDTLEVMIPEGHFVVKTDHLKSREHYFFAAGSGITPVISMISTILEEEPKSTCYLLYGSRDENNIIFKDALDGLARKYADQLYIEHVLSKPIEKKTGGIGGLFAKKVVEWKGMSGRISPAACTEFLQKYAPKNDEKQYYICGPGDLIQKVEQFLTDRHIDKKSIHREYFTAAPSADGKAPSTGSGVVSVTLKGDTFDIDIPKGKTILDVLVDAKKDPPYSCTSGACSTCIAKVSEGTVEMDSCYALEDDEVAAGYILTCQAHPTSAKVVLSYDV
jgi:ring-1,2-phenylacetyl-CoA epoxidase subunit PaaE